ncbi:MAG: hypothetical protein RMY28_009235 [Nostoc sp. ChiSLP01]|nr:hypothetical protein [Nostoc sp. CmiSLP01]MDZ8285260.1 hypothetical protein [Nostoc sp. ChiSLP01]
MDKILVKLLGKDFDASVVLTRVPCAGEQIQFSKENAQITVIVKEVCHFDRMDGDEGFAAKLIVDLIKKVVADSGFRCWGSVRFPRCYRSVPPYTLHLYVLGLQLILNAEL